MSETNFNPVVEIEYHFEENMQVELDLHRIMSAIYELPLKRKLNIVAGILNNLEPEINSESEPLTDDQKELIRSYLAKQLKRFE
jgi:hypothetical protein